MLKKGISSLLIGIIALNNGAAYADDSSDIEACVADIYESQEYYYADQVSENTKNMIDKALGSFVKKLEAKGYSIEKHIAVYDIVIDKVDSKVANLDNSSSYEAYDILEYIRSALVSYKNLAEAELYCKADAAKVLPGADEIAEIDEQIMDMQNAMADFVEESFDKLIGELERSFGVVETGDINMNLSLNLADINIEANLNLDDYTMKQSLFDSQFSSDMKAFLKVDDRGELMTFDISGFLDFISKDGNTYVLLENMNFSTENIEEIQDMLGELKKLSEDKTYIQIPADEGYDEIVSALRSFDPSSIVTEMRSMMSEPLFQVDEKIGDTYILVPTKFACDTGKKLGGRFDPFFSNEECSDSQYKKLVKKSNSDEFQIFMKANGNSSELGIKANDGYVTTNVSINYDGEKMSNAEITSFSNDLPNEGLKAEYVYGSHLDLNINAEGIILDWKNKLRSNNSFSEAEISLQGKDGDMAIDGDFQMKSGNIEGALYVKESEKMLFSLVSTGEYSGSDGTFSIENKYMFSENPFSYMGVGEMSDTVNGNINMEFMMKNPDSTVDVRFNTVVADEEIINFEVTSSSTVESKEFDIETPEKFKSIEEVDVLY